VLESEGKAAWASGNGNLFRAREKNFKAKVFQSVREKALQMLT
jgi:hypothetical protein